MSRSPAVKRESLIIAERPQARFGGDKPAPKKPAAKKKPAPKKKPATPAVPETPPEPPKFVIPETREDIQAAYTFTPEEVGTMNHQLRQALTDIETLQAQKKAAVQDFALRIANKTNDTKSLRNKLDAGEETRPMRAAVGFDTARGMKSFYHPETCAFIREEAMQPADWQLPLLKTDETGKEAPAPKGAPDQKDGKGKTPKPSVPPASSPAGQTNVGNALDAAAANTKAAQFLLDLTKDDWTDKGLMAAFRAAAKKAGWTPPQVSALADRLKETETVEAMIDTLRPFTIAPKTVQVGDITLPALDFEMADGFPADKYRNGFLKAAKAAEWPTPCIEEVDSYALTQQNEVGDEPEAGQAVRKYLAQFQQVPAVDPTAL